MNARRTALVVVGGLWAALVFCSYRAGERIGRNAEQQSAQAQAPAIVALERVGQELADSQRRLARLRWKANRHFDDMARRVGRVQARVVRLDALAYRLAEHPMLDAADERASEEQIDGRAPRAVRSAQHAGPLERLSISVDEGWRELRMLEESLESRALSARVRPAGKPVAKAYVSSGFGKRVDPFTGEIMMHEGVDFAAARGSPVVAVGPGTVTRAGTHGGYGRMIEIEHGPEFATRYAHNSENLVSVGDVVMRGQTVARLGASGRATGPNLHFEVLRNGRPVDPLDFSMAPDGKRLAMR